MHEASIAAELIKIAQSEMKKCGLEKLLKIRISCGRLTCVSPESLRFNLEIMLRAASYNNAVIEIEEVPVHLLCSSCGHTFIAADREVLLNPCPVCAAQSGHKVLSGQDLRLESIDAE